MYPFPERIKMVSEAKGGKTYECKSLGFDLEEQRATFGFGAELPVGSYKFSATFRGVLNDKLAGFYRR